MNVLWKVVKVALALVLLIPLSLLALGLFGTILGLSIALLRLAVLGLLAYGAFRLAARLVRRPKRVEPRKAPSLNAADPFYDAAIKELDRDLAR